MWSSVTRRTADSPVASQPKQPKQPKQRAPQTAGTGQAAGTASAQRCPGDRSGESLGAMTTTAAMLRLQSDLRAIRREPPEVRHSGPPAGHTHHSLMQLRAAIRQRARGLRARSTTRQQCSAVLWLRAQCLSRSPPTHPPHLQGCSASPADDTNLFVWTGTIFGPEDTAFEGEAPSCSAE